MKTVEAVIAVKRGMKTVEEAAAELGLSVHTLNGWRVKGCGPEYQKFGSAVRYTDEAIQKFKDAGKRQSTSQPVQACA